MLFFDEVVDLIEEKQEQGLGIFFHVSTTKQKERKIVSCQENLGQDKPTYSSYKSKLFILSTFSIVKAGRSFYFFCTIT